MWIIRPSEGSDIGKEQNHTCDMPDSKYMNTFYDGALLTSPIVETGVMLGVRPDSDREYLKVKDSTYHDETIKDVDPQYAIFRGFNINHESVSIFHLWKLCGTCTTIRAQQMIVYCE